MRIKEGVAGKKSQQGGGIPVVLRCVVLDGRRGGWFAWLTTPAKSPLSLSSFPPPVSVTFPHLHLHTPIRGAGSSMKVTHEALGKLVGRALLAESLKTCAKQAFSVGGTT